MFLFVMDNYSNGHASGFTPCTAVKVSLLPVLQTYELHKTGSQPVKTGSQPVKQEVNKVLKTGFLFYSLTSCVIDLLVLSAVVFPPDFKSQLMLL